MGEGGAMGWGLAEDVTSLYCGIKPFCSMEKSRPFTGKRFKKKNKKKTPLDVLVNSEAAH